MRARWYDGRRAAGALLAAVVALTGTGCSSGSSSASPSATSSPTPAATATATLAPNDGRILSAIEDGAVLHGITGWQVSPRFPAATTGEAVVLFFIDDTFAWRERHEPYRFQGDDAEFDTRHLTNGPHTLSVTATYPSGQRARFEARVTVRNNGPIVPGPYTDYGYTAVLPNLPGLAVAKVALGGRWLLSFPAGTSASRGVLRVSPETDEPLDVPYTRRPDGTLVLTPPDCASVQLVPQVDAGALRFGTRAAPGAGCRGWITLLSDRSWSQLPG